MPALAHLSCFAQRQNYFSHRAASSTGLFQVALYAGRLACAMVLMEVMSHALYFNSIAKYKLWQQYRADLCLSAVDMGMTGFWVLLFMWLKVRP